MDDYEMITRLGGGSFADVYKAKEKSTGELVAIKVLKRKYKKWEDCLELRECSSLQKLHDPSLTNKPGAENIIKLKQIIFIKKTGTLNLVFEYMKTDLLELMKEQEPRILNEEQIRDIMYQTLLGLSFMHKYGFFHRDMKPENLLLNGKKIKIADFGLAREIRSVPPYTEYVSTRYYRAPECILQFTNYNSPIDIWGLGCIMAEMYLHPQPLFCGSNEKEVLFKICSVLGTPTYDTWNDGIQQANIVGIKFPTNPGIDLEKIITGASSEAIDLIKQMLQWDPNKRATAKALLKHPFFTNHTINSYFYTDIQSDIFFGDNNVKKYSNNDNNTKKREVKNNDKLSNNNDIDDNDFGIEDNDNDNDNNYGGILNDIEKFDNLINKLKEEKNEEDKNYEKEKNKYDEEDYDINNIVGNYNNNNESNFTDDKKNENLFDDDMFNGGNINSDSKPYDESINTKKEDYSTSNKGYSLSNQNDYTNSDLKRNYSNNFNRRGNARNFLEQYENNYNNDLNNKNSNNVNFNFNNINKAKTNDFSNSNDFSDFNMGDNGTIGSLFGNGSRRRHDKNYEL
jgi:serine/threonine protein kinase